MSGATSPSRYGSHCLQANHDGSFCRLAMFDATNVRQRSDVQRAVALLAALDPRVSFRITAPDQPCLNYSAERGWTQEAS